VSEARRWLASQTTPYRALWVAEPTKPTNAGAILDRGRPQPEFSPVPTDEVAGPVRAAEREAGLRLADLVVLGL